MAKETKGISLIKRLSRMLPLHSFSQNINHLYDLILHMVMYFKVKQTIKVYVKKLSLFNTMLL